VACFLVPMTIAIITSLLRKRCPKALRINVLNLFLWGGALGLAFEHLAHKEIVPYPPFLTAGVEHVVPEMLTVGVPMTMAVSGVWALIILVVERPLSGLFRPSRLGAIEVHPAQK
jgi:hypothetical protein